ncbi:syntaxin 6, n-terminal protein [Cardiosporidium cionae]|uniref:Syntaxin 6, n-terminal protein n=1 Tax=Cardiosporidium cionae TaxID=476202 RepID=A0ABQ7JG64_9APIC|nr:syntaxin 6, n-terminal protein [Cardiosporidium cionae]|eukprot:KAF8822919.1 syntaxin 6, n-terminal protein [Cardiosporidium cionae]
MHNTEDYIRRKQSDVDIPLRNGNCKVRTSLAPAAVARIPNRTWLDKMTNMNSEEPFYVALNQINGSTSTLRENISNWQYSVKKLSDQGFRNTSDNSKEIVSQLTEVEGLTEEIVKYAASVTVDSNKRPLSSEEILKRKSIAEDQRRKIKELRTQIKEIKSSTAESNTADTAGKNFFTSRSQHEKLLSKQDEQLGELAKSAERLHTSAHTINNEIIDQQRLLTELDSDVETQTTRMQHVMRIVTKLSKISDKKLIWFVVGMLILDIVLVVVFFL